MTLTRQKITAFCERNHWPIQWGPEGGALLGGFTLRAGSGIAGRSASFFLWHRTGWKSVSATNLTQLRAILMPHRASLWWGLESKELYWLKEPLSALSSPDEK